MNGLHCIKIGINLGHNFHWFSSWIASVTLWKNDSPRKPPCFNHLTHKHARPCESAAVCIRESKQISDVMRDVRFALGYSDAEKFYTTLLGPTDSNRHRHKSSGLGLGWNKEDFRAWLGGIVYYLAQKNTNGQAMAGKVVFELLWGHSDNGGSLECKKRRQVLRLCIRVCKSTHMIFCTHIFELIILK